MNGQAFGDIAEEKPSTFTLSAAMEAYKREEGSMQIKPTEELEMLQQERLTDAVDFIPSANSNTSTFDTEKRNNYNMIVDDDNFEDFYETQNYTLICRISEKFYESIKSIMYHHVVGVAFEGQNLGRTGVLSLVQVATGSEIIVFDMVRLGDEAFKAGLQCLFESEDVMKVIHDCRWVADLLRFQYDITMANIFDTQVANAFVHRIFNEGKWPKHVQSLPDCLSSYFNLQRHEVHSPHINEENEIGWLERPLPPELLDLATKNAVHLLRLHRVLLEEMLSEFKAAVEIYLNLTSGGVEDLKKHQMTSHLLPAAFMCLHTYIKNPSGSCSRKEEHSRFKDFWPRSATAVTTNLQDQNFFATEEYDNMGIAVVESPNEKTDTGYETLERMAILSPCCSSRLEKEQIKLVHLNQQEDESSSANSTSKKYLDHQEQSIPNVMKYPLLPTHDHSQKEDISQPKAVHPGLVSAYTKNSQPFSQNSKTIPGSDGILSLRSSTPAEMQETCRRKMIEESQCSTSKKLCDHQHIGKHRGNQEKAAHFYVKENILMQSVQESGPSPSSNISKCSIVEDHDGKHFECSACFETFTSRESLALHNITHLKQKAYTCDLCNKDYASLKGIGRHIKIHSGVGTVRCDICGKHYDCQSLLKIHKRTHTGERPYKCDICEKGFIKSSHLYAHMRSNHLDEKPYQCAWCDRRLVNTYSKQNHEKICRNKQFQCDVCKRRFEFRYELDTHFQKYKDCMMRSSFISPQAKPVCDVCQESFPNKILLNRHKTTHKTQSLSCSESGKTFKSIQLLESQQVVDTREKPHMCDECGRSFVTRTELRLHRNRHSESYEREYKCSTCHKSYWTKSYLTVHEKTHLEDRPYKCDVCGKAFKKMSHLGDHKRTHSDIKPHKCHLCARRFRRPSHLKAHVKTIHSADNHTKRRRTDPSLYRPHKCDLCNKSYFQHSSLTVHKRTHNII